jgi:2-oxoglutarate ferredoxin oxidoreductase subunit beta
MVEILSPCPTNWKMSPIDACKWIDDTMSKTYPPGVIKDVTTSDRKEVE